MIQLRNVSFRYDSSFVFSDTTLTIPEGELILVAGPTGSGKSTLLSLINGLAPSFTGGEFSGEVWVDEKERSTSEPLEWSQLVATVQQSPVDGFVADTVEDEIVFGMETHGYPFEAMKQRLHEVSELLGLSDLRSRQLSTLSGGQQQRVAIAAALTLNPRVLLLDEPTSALDPTAADEVLSAIHRIVHDLGITVLVAEHRLERILPFADQVLLINPESAPLLTSPAAAVSLLPHVPTLARLAQLAGADEVPLTVRDARRVIAPLRDRLSHKKPILRALPDSGDGQIQLKNVAINRGKRTVLQGLTTTFAQGSATAIMGKNGAGKSTLLHTLMGDYNLVQGSITYNDSPFERGKVECGFVPQQPSDLFLTESVADECRLADSLKKLSPGSTRALLALLSPDVNDGQHPHELSEGQRLGLALALTLASEPEILLLDEPTRGLDSHGKRELHKVIAELKVRNCTIVVATHDVELAAEVADRIVVLADGAIVTEGNSHEVLTASTMFAPVTAKVLSPLQWISVGEVERALG